jgi:Lrp/AsnC family transcriptional regulator for asnA, asnC and gidA
LSQAFTLDSIDTKILKDLLIDGRKEFTKIAKEANVSKDVIWHRYNKMKNKGIIIGATIQLNYPVLGYNGSANFIIDISLPKRHEIIKKLERIPGLHGAYYWNNPSRLYAISDFTKVEQINKIRQKINAMQNVTKIETEIITGLRGQPENLSILNDSKTSNKKESTKSIYENKINDVVIKIDDIDKQIIEILTDNSRVSFRFIGKKLGIATSTAIRRYNNLKQNNVIRTVIQINPKKIGYSFNTCYRLMIDGQMHPDRIAQEIVKIPDIIATELTTNAYGITIFTEIKSIDHLSTLEDRIVSIPGIKRINGPILTKFSELPYKREHMSTF